MARLVVKHEPRQATGAAKKGRVWRKIANPDAIRQALRSFDQVPFGSARRFRLGPGARTRANARPPTPAQVATALAARDALMKGRIFSDSASSSHW